MSSFLRMALQTAGRARDRRHTLVVHCRARLLACLPIIPLSPLSAALVGWTRSGRLPKPILEPILITAQGT
jgi:hypothetical protein